MFEPKAFQEVLRDELRCIRTRRARGTTRRGSSAGPRTPPPAPDTGRRVESRAWDAWLVGLALSGGGIRSATFNLGILQSLANLRLIRRLDYLSTVSGGGYIGGWLTALIQRENARGESGTPATERVEARIASCRAEHEDHAVTHLRRHSNYLTPRTGALSADMWSAVATYLRNLFLNLVTLVSALGIVLLLPRLLALAPRLLPNQYDALVLLALTLVCGLSTAGSLGFNLGSFHSPTDPAARDDDHDRVVPPFGQRDPEVTREREPARKGRRSGQDAQPVRPDSEAKILKRLVGPLVLGAALASLCVPELVDPISLESIWLNAHFPGLLPVSTLHWGLALGLFYFFLWVLARRRARRLCLIGESAGRRRLWRRLVITAFFAAGSAGLLHWVIAHGLVFGPLSEAARHLARLALGPPQILAWLYVVAVLHTGLMGRFLEDRQREWLSRLGAWFLMFALAWLVLFGIALAGPLALDLAGHYTRLGLASGWILTTIAGLIAGRGSPEAQGMGGRVRGLLARLTPYVFILGLIIALSAGLNRALFHTGTLLLDTDRIAAAETLYDDRMALWLATASPGGDGGAPRFELDREGDLQPAPAAHPGRASLGDMTVAYLDLLGHLQDPRLLCLLTLSLWITSRFMSRWIHVNEFSLYRFYQNRLVRCYLGASVDPDERREKHQPFTGFYAADDIPLSDCGDCSPYADRPPGTRHRYSGPIPIINTAINLVAGTELAWQHRKAASFALTPLYCGFIPSHGESAYRRTSHFATRPTPITLGAALATSGAAASPSMGFRTTPAFAFLLSLFNIRLGRWVGNPADASWRQSAPDPALTFLLMELLGLTRSTTPFIYLSDGGHFENLGIYELVKRRCRFVIACDAAADPEYRFDDLGNCIRKCRTDLGVEIRIQTDRLRRTADTGFSQWHCAVGDILYPADPAEDTGRLRGTLLYIKASLTGDEPEDVLGYAVQNSPFPQQSTADQFFDEAQFESYRRLGEHIGREVLADALEADRGPDGGITLEQAVMFLRQRWRPPLPVDEGVFTRLTGTLHELFERQRNSPDLKFLDAQIYPEWPFTQGAPSLSIASRACRNPAAEPTPFPGAMSLPKEESHFRAGFYFCNSLIQLMEDVYLDLDLEAHWNHPDNRGWVNLFRHWAWVGMFRTTWAICAATYGRRFQLFCERHLNLELRTVSLSRPLQINGRANLQELQTALAKAIDRSDGSELQGRLFEQADGADLNLPELDQILGHLVDAGRPPETYRVYQLELEVTHPRLDARATPTLPHFVCGYALVSGRRIHLFRIRDHLRKMGLGRRALLAMLDAEPSLRIASEDRNRRNNDADRAGSAGDPCACAQERVDFDPVYRRRFQELYHSVRSQLAQADDRFSSG